MTVIASNVHNMLSPEPWDIWPFIELGGGGFGSSSSASFPFSFYSLSALLFSFHRPTLADGLGLLFSVSLKRRVSTLFSLFLGSFGKCPVHAVHLSGDRSYDYLLLLLLPSHSDVS